MLMTFSWKVRIFIKRPDFLDCVDGKIKCILQGPTTHIVIVSQNIIKTLSDEGSVEENNKNLVCWLNNKRYDLTQMSGCWNKKFDSFIMSLGF